MKIPVMCVVALAVLCTAWTSSFARFEIRPYLSVKEEFNDNLFLTETDREHDFITSINPSVFFTYSPNDDLDMGLHYGYNFRFYGRNSDLNATSMSEAQHVRFQTKFRPTSRLFIEVTDIYTRVPIDDQLSTTPENPFENMTAMNMFRVAPTAVLPITSTMTSQFGYRYINVWHDEEVSNDIESHSAYASLTQVFPMGLSVSLNYDYAPVDAEDTADYDRHDVSVNVGYQINENFRIFGGYGTAFLDYDEDSIEMSGLAVDPFTGAIISGRSFETVDDEDEAFWSAGASYEMDVLGGTEIKVSYEETFSHSAITQEIWREEFRYIPIAFIEDSLLVMTMPTGAYILDSSSTTTGLSKLKRFDVFLKAGDDIKFTVNPYYKTEDELEKVVFVPTGTTDRLDLSREDETKGVAITVTKPMNLFGRSSELSFGATYEKQKYSDSGFDEKIRWYYLGTSLSHSLSKSIYLTIAYNFSDKDSDFEGKDFHNNIAWIKAEVSF